MIMSLLARSKSLSFIVTNCVFPSHRRKCFGPSWRSQSDVGVANDNEGIRRALTDVTERSIGTAGTADFCGGEDAPFQSAPATAAATARSIEISEALSEDDDVDIGDVQLVQKRDSFVDSVRQAGVKAGAEMNRPPHDHIHFGEAEEQLIESREVTVGVNVGDYVDYNEERVDSVYDRVRQCRFLNARVRIFRDRGELFETICAIIRERQLSAGKPHLSRQNTTRESLLRKSSAPKPAPKSKMSSHGDTESGGDVPELKIGGGGGDGDEDDEESGLRLEEKIKLHHLEEIALIYERKGEEEAAERGDDGADDEDEPPGLDREEFVEAMSGVLGTDDYAEDLHKMFSKLDNSGDGNVDFQELLTYLLLQYRENDFLRQKRDSILLHLKPTSTYLVQNRLEASIGTVALDTPIRFATVSKSGILSVLDTQLQTETTVDVLAAVNADIAQSAPGGGGAEGGGGGAGGLGGKKRFRPWCQDIAYISSLKKVVVSTSARELLFVDVGAAAPFVEMRIHSLKRVPTALDVAEDGMSVSLWLGCDNGSIIAVHFHKAQQQLLDWNHILQKDSTGGTVVPRHGAIKKANFKKDLRDDAVQSQFCKVEEWKIHEEAVCKLSYLKSKREVLSCALSQTTSMVRWDPARKRQPYVYRVKKGVTSFDTDMPRSLIATGSPDYAVRLWTFYVSAKPVAVLEGHVCPITDVVFLLGHLISYTTGEKLMKLWDVNEQKCLETVGLHFPEGATFKDNPTRGMCIRPTKDDPEHLVWLSMLWSACVTIYCVGAGPDDALAPGANWQTGVTTHRGPVTALCYNEKTRQIATGSEDGNACIWDVENGNRALLLTGCHNKDHISVTSFDYTGRRLITGSSTGELKIWNPSNGQLLTTCLYDTEMAEVTGIAGLSERRKIVTVGWNKRITKYDDYDIEQTQLVPDEPSWMGGQLHTDDILCCAVFPTAGLLVSAGFDGEVLVWNITTERLFCRLHPPLMAKTLLKMPLVVAALSRHGSSDSQIKRRQSTTTSQGSTNKAPVEAVVWLESRWTNKDRSAVLMSCAGPRVFAWGLFTQQQSMGHFAALDEPDESVMAMCRDVNDQVLVVGDTLGWLRCFNIATYALKQPETPDQRPPLLNAWQASEVPILKLIAFSTSQKLFCVSAGGDRCARLWSVPYGLPIGIFGQPSPWDLKLPQGLEGKSHSMTSRDMKGKEDEDEREDSTLEAVPQLLLTKKQTSLTEDEMKPGTGTATATSGGRVRSQMPDYRRSLGMRWEQTVTRRSKARLARRRDFGWVDPEPITRWQGNCAPYQALNLLSTGDPKIPKQLPVTDRMSRKGANVGEAENWLRKINFKNLKSGSSFSFGPDDSEEKTDYAATHLGRHDKTHYRDYIAQETGRKA